VKVVVSDGALTDEEEIEITVNEVQSNPVLDAIGNKTIDELALLSFTAYGVGSRRRDTFVLAGEPGDWNLPGRCCDHGGWCIYVDA
jgi:hypothetical protein